MDDIDDLLDEVESKYCSNKTKSDISQKKTTKRKPARPSELDDAIDDIIADDGLDDMLKSNSKSSSKKERTLSVGSSSSKCYSIYIGDTSFEKGYTTTGQQRSCDKLHCTSCDNKIVSFENYKWAEEDCDYLIFRNNYPDFHRLQSKLIPRKGYQSFCCQCCWVSVKDMVELKTFKPAFKWICKKH